VESTLHKISMLDHYEIFEAEHERFAGAKLANAQFVLPKLCLLLGTMRKVGLDDVQYFKPIIAGNCSALLTSARLWTDEPLSMPVRAARLPAGKELLMFQNSGGSSTAIDVDPACGDLSVLTIGSSAGKKRATSHSQLASREGL